MGKVILGMTMSLHGFINDRNGSVAVLYPDLVDWRETQPGKESIENTGAVAMGRNSYAMAEAPDWFAGNYEYQVPIFVLTHKPPEKMPKQPQAIRRSTSSVQPALRGKPCKQGLPMSCTLISCRYSWAAVCGHSKLLAPNPFNWRE